MIPVVRARLFPLYRRRRSWPSLVTACAVTIALFVLALRAMTTVHSFGGFVRDKLASRRASEHLVLVTPRRPVPPLAPSAPSPTGSRRGFAPAGARNDSGSAPVARGETAAPPAAESPGVRPNEPTSPRASDWLARSLAPLAADRRIAATGEKPLTAAGRDSLLDSLRRALPEDLKRPVPPRPAERDSLAREESIRRRAQADVPGVRPQVVLGTVSFPFLSSGPTREQRRRDSIVNADNLARLGRLADRARARRESTIVARRDSMADSAHRMLLVRPPRANPDSSN
jgi:hypothetical protein